MRTSSLRAQNQIGVCRISALAFIATGVAAALAKQHPQMPNYLIHANHPFSLRLSVYCKSGDT